MVRPEQLRLRDTAFVVATPDASSGSGFTGFGSNELGLRFSTAAAAASLLAACEAIVGESAEHAAETTRPVYDDLYEEMLGGSYAPNYGATPQQRPPPVSSTASLRTPRPSVGGRATLPGSATSSTSRLPFHRARAGSAHGAAGWAASAARPTAESGAGEELPQQAEQDVLRLTALLAERDMEAGRLLKRLEQAQGQVRARDAKIVDLTRRLAKSSGGAKF